MKCHTYVQETYARTIKQLTSNIKKNNNLHTLHIGQTCYWETHTFNQKKSHTVFKYKMSGSSFDFAVQNLFTLLHLLFYVHGKVAPISFTVCIC